MNSKNEITENRNCNAHLEKTGQMCSEATRRKTRERNKSMGILDCRTWEDALEYHILLYVPIDFPAYIDSPLPELNNNLSEEYY